MNLDPFGQFSDRELWDSLHLSRIFSCSYETSPKGWTTTADQQGRTSGDEVCSVTRRGETMCSVTRRGETMCSVTRRGETISGFEG